MQFNQLLKASTLGAPEPGHQEDKKKKKNHIYWIAVLRSWSRIFAIKPELYCRAPRQLRPLRLSCTDFKWPYTKHNMQCSQLIGKFFV
jgi:hypothetical protein